MTVFTSSMWRTIGTVLGLIGLPGSVLLNSMINGNPNSWLFLISPPFLLMLLVCSCWLYGVRNYNFVLMFLPLAWWTTVILLFCIACFFRVDPDTVILPYILGFITFDILAILCYMSIEKPAVYRNDLEANQVPKRHNERSQIYPTSESSSKIDDYSQIMKDTTENVLAKFNSLHGKLDKTPEMQNEENLNQTPSQMN